MAGGEAMIAVGIGFRNGGAPEPIMALVEQALSQISIGGEAVTLVSHDRKRAEAGLAEAARRLGYPLRFVSQEDAVAADAGSATRSDHSLRTTGLACFSEAVALAAAGPGAHLLLTRIVSEGVACAIAQGETP
jgi:cobalt-precorrin 5A hydrolase